MSESQEPRVSSVACLACRKVKMKCRPSQSAGTCERCRRKGFNCLFQQHRRGHHRKLRVRETVIPVQPEKSRASEKDTAEERIEAAQPERQSSGDTNIWTNSDSFQPAGILNKQATKGAFSLQNILSTQQSSKLRHPQLPSNLPADDPVEMGLINPHVAASIFDGFMKDLNPFICIFDPILHTLAYVQARSSFLLTAILAAGAKAFNQALYPALYKHVEKLFIDSFRLCEKSTEVVQAIMLMTYWKEPTDTRAWTSIGLAIRICIELDWHKFPITSDCVGPSDVKRRQERNKERTWLVLFVYDRSLSMQTGKPWMIEPTELIKSVHNWYKGPFAASNDTLLCAFVRLRLITSDVFDLVSPKRSIDENNSSDIRRPLIKSLCVQIEEWQRQWMQETESERCHQLMVPLFGCHIRLLLCSFVLQASVSSPSRSLALDNEGWWVSYSVALEMLQVISEASLSPLLYFAHDSVHVMIAYAAGFIVKLLLQVPKAILSEIESPTIEVLKVTARIFAQQGTAASSGCALQAKFLNNVVQEFGKGSTHRHREHSSLSKDAQPPIEGRGSLGERSQTLHRRLPEKTGHRSTSGMEMDNVQISSSLSYRGLDADTQSNVLVPPGHFSDDAGPQEVDPWEAIFADIGFDMNDGTLFPNFYT